MSSQPPTNTFELRAKRAIGLALLYPLLFPTPIFWIVFLGCRYFGYWTNGFYFGLGLAALGVPIGILVGFITAPQENLFGDAMPSEPAPGPDERSESIAP